MRPGQTAPECKQWFASISTTCSGFNEAGADCPGMLGFGGAAATP